MQRKIFFILVMFISPYFSNSQSNQRAYIGVYFTGDAAMYYTGPSILAGVDIPLRKKIILSPYAHYFSRDIGNHSFKTWSFAVLFQMNIGKKKRFYLAAGPAFQRAIEEDDYNYYNDLINRSVLLPAYRVGYVITLKKYTVCPEICTSGPYSDGGTTELFTLPSAGLRIYRNRGLSNNEVN